MMEKALRWQKNGNIFISHTSINPHQNALSHLDKLPGLFLAVIPEAIVDPEAQQLQGWLGAKEVMGRHVEVVQEAQQALPTRWHKLSFGSLLDAALHDGLDVIRGGLDSDGDTEIQEKVKSMKQLQQCDSKIRQ